MQEAKPKTIDGITFTVQQLPYRKSARLMHKLVGALGPALLRSLAGAPMPDFAKGGAGAAMAADLDLGNVAVGMQALFDRFSAEDFDRLVNELFETTTVAGEGLEGLLLPQLDFAMAGRHGTMLKAIQFALEVNYGNFLGAFLAALPKPAKASAPQSKA